MGIQQWSPLVVVTDLHASLENPVYNVQVFCYVTHDVPLYLHVDKWSTHKSVEYDDNTSVHALS
jgi:hypothetical protein